jgi:hypothetical protein
MTTTYWTVVVHLAPTPLGPLPARWHIEHRCTACFDNVPIAESVPGVRRLLALLAAQADRAGEGAGAGGDR